MNIRNRAAALLLVIAMLACNNPALTVTPSLPTATPINEPVNCRIGAGLAWETVGALSLNQTAAIQGRNADASWWYVLTPNAPAAPCWVAASVVTTSGDLSALPVVADPAAAVTAISVEVTPQAISLAGCVGPVPTLEITGSIHANGPLSVEYRFETQQGGEMAPQNVEFTEAGTQTVEIDLTPPAEEGEFWIRLVIIQPASESVEATYTIDCTP